MLSRQDRPPTAADKESSSVSGTSADFIRIRALIEQEIKGLDAEIEQVKAKLSGLEAQREKLGHDLEHVQATMKILERFSSDTRRPAKPCPAPTPRPKTSCSHLTQREAILQILYQDPSQALNKKTLTQALVDGGFPFRSVERTERQNTVYQTCRRMVEARELTMLIQGRDAYYRLVDTTPSRPESFPAEPRDRTNGRQAGPGHVS